jgi:hypothetical protein
MKPAKLLLFAAVLLVSTVIKAQTVDEIITKYADAVGGKEKLSQVKSVYTEISVEIMGNNAPVTESLLEGKGYKTETEFNGSKIVNCFTDKNGWFINAMAGASTAQAMPEALYKAGKAQIYFGGALTDYATKGYKAELAGTEEGSFKIKVSGDGGEYIYFIDQKSYLLNKSIVKSEMMGQQIDVATSYSDYKKTDAGLLVAYTRNVDMGMFQMTQKVNKAEINKELDAKIFEMPK